MPLDFLAACNTDKSFKNSLLGLPLQYTHQHLHPSCLLLYLHGLALLFSISSFSLRLYSVFMILVTLLYLYFKIFSLYFMCMNACLHVCMSITVHIRYTAEATDPLNLELSASVSLYVDSEKQTQVLYKRSSKMLLTTHPSL